MIMNQNGSITVDYLFAFFLVAGFSSVIMTFSVTLSTVEVVQYMAFASARNFMAGNVSPQKQSEAASRKFFALKDSPVVAPLLSGGWFNVPDESFIADYNLPAKHAAFEEYAPDPLINLFHGVVVGFESRILDFQIPFFGGTKKSDQDSDAGFTANITAFLGREPSFDECDNFNRQRWNFIRNLHASYSAAQDSNSYTIINDNGC